MTKKGWKLTGTYVGLLNGFVGLVRKRAMSLRKKKGFASAIEYLKSVRAKKTDKKSAKNLGKKPDKKPSKPAKLTKGYCPYCAKRVKIQRRGYIMKCLVCGKRVD